MKTLHKYLVGQVLATLLLTVSVFAFVVVLLNGLPQVLPLLLSGHVKFALIAKAIALLLPFAFVYALPMGFITATLLVFGRFSADQELTAARAGGVSLLSLCTPVLLLSLLCCGLSAWFNLKIGPQSRADFVNLRSELLANVSADVIPEKQFIPYFSGFLVFVEKNRNGNLENVTIYPAKGDTTNVIGKNFFFRAPKGHVAVNPTNQMIVMVLTNLVGVVPAGQSSQPRIQFQKMFALTYEPKKSSGHPSKPKVSDMTFAQLQTELQELQQMNVAGAKRGAVAETNRPGEKFDPETSSEEIAAQIQAAEKVRQGEIERVRVTMHGEMAFSFACFGFALIGIPLGIRVHRRETNIGIGIALGLVMVYYGFTLLGNSLATRPEFYPHLTLWIPNLLFQAIGAALLWRANRGI